MSDDQSQKSVTILRLGRTRGRADRHSVLFGLNMRHFSGKLSPVDAAAEVIYPDCPNLGKCFQLFHSAMPARSDNGISVNHTGVCCTVPAEKMVCVSKVCLLSNAGAAGKGGNPRHCERVFFHMRLVDAMGLVIPDNHLLLSDIPML